MDGVRSAADLPAAIRAYSDERMADELGYASWNQSPPYLPDGQDGWNPGYPLTKDTTTPYRECGTMSLPRALKPHGMSVGVVGVGPAGLYVAIAMAQRGHHVVVTDRLESPSVRGTCVRDRSYVMDISARGMAALDFLPGVLDEGSALRRHTLPFLGHRSLGTSYELTRHGLIGTRDDSVLGLLVHIEERQSEWPGSVQVFFGVATNGVDLRSRTLDTEVVAGGSGNAHMAAAAQGPFDLIVACDGRNSAVRDTAAK